MNTNRNLHSTKVLTEFARDFDDEEDTGILSQFVNKISNIVNTNYNTLSAYPSTSTNVGSNTENANPADSVASPTKEQAENVKESPVTSKQPEKPDELPLDENVGRTPLNVIQRISNLIAQKDNLLQVLSKEHLDAATWSKILIQISVRVANQIRPETVCFDSMDIRNFINIKKISAGTPSDSCIIGGVVFSKNVTHKDMATHIEKPRILLLQCPILYQRVEGKFVTLDNLMMQERESLRNVTLRIQSWGPNIVLVHKSVAGIAQEMLRDKGITLVLDVKMSILERLARTFQCDIVTSIDSNIKHPKLGVCDAFYRKTYSDTNGISKSLMFFEKRYENSRGCCVLLRGAPIAELTKIKKVVSTMIFARYNWKREISFLVNEFARPPSPKHKYFESPKSPDSEGKGIETHLDEAKNDREFIKSQKNITGSAVEDFSDPLRADLTPNLDDSSSKLHLEVQTTYDNRLRNALSSTILSISPHMTFPLPYLETEIGRNCELRQRFPDELFYSKQWSTTPVRENVVEIVDDEENLVILKPPHEYVTHQVTAPAESKEEQDLLANFRMKGGRYPKRMTMRIINKKSNHGIRGTGTSIEDHIYKDALDLENHQRLPVLFYSFYSSAKATSSFCYLPYMLEMHFYGQNDIMFGLFLQKYCFRSPCICPSCNLPMIDHVRRYVHSMGCVQIKIREDKRYEGSDKIMMTSFCTICNETTPTVPISDDSWCLSLAKYLELRFHGHGYRRNYLK
ncbi:putative 1-phosphatidylinositol 3-phosphate 5-kinase, partial [Culicoides brevitarsis]|uniref:putative 1-phosphatidylinositol 3-phosphate 5-kinase n=1 Tax=Culicoides brevitarsis TaxID=469753 RepID=UPI00307C9D47